jgi:hypothetical protein
MVGGSREAEGLLDQPKGELNGLPGYCPYLVCEVIVPCHSFVYFVAKPAEEPDRRRRCAESSFVNRKRGRYKRSILEDAKRRLEERRLFRPSRKCPRPSRKCPVPQMPVRKCHCLTSPCLLLQNQSIRVLLLPFSGRSRTPVSTDATRIPNPVALVLISALVISYLDSFPNA